MICSEVQCKRYNYLFSLQTFPITLKHNKMQCVMKNTCENRIRKLTQYIVPYYRLFLEYSILTNYLYIALNYNRSECVVLLVNMKIHKIV